MCQYCGSLLSAVHWTEAGAVSARDRTRATSRRAEVLQAVLRAYGLSLRQGALVGMFHISSADGREGLARDLDEVWAVAEQMTGRHFDPLDARFTAEDADAG